MNKIDIILFDLGGVLVELTGVSTMLEWTGNKLNERELWEVWLNSPSVRSFEKGHYNAEQFAISLIKEMGLPVGMTEFIDRFTYWPSGLFPGVSELINKLKKHKTLACFSNSNELHWPRLMQDMGIEKMFKYHFASHIIGKLKPDKESFEHVLKILDCYPSSVLFFDDNELNVSMAKEIGMIAYKVKGPKQIDTILTDGGILDSSNKNKRNTCN